MLADYAKVVVTDIKIPFGSMVYYLTTDSLAAVALTCLAKPDWMCRLLCTISS